jgi:hypothetical protein
MDTRYKGFQLVTLTREKHHVDFITVPWGSQDYQPNCEYAFDLYSAGAPAPALRGSSARCPKRCWLHAAIAIDSANFTPGSCT